jgi:myo-inositol-1(or 4)-monophosphatase
MSMIAWPVPPPDLPTGVHPALAAAALASATAFRAARATWTREDLAEQVAMGADGTPTMRVDALVEEAIAQAAVDHRVNLLSEEAGFLDHGSALTLVVDPMDGSANAAMGVPLCSFAGVLVTAEKPTEALTLWFDTGRCWWAKAGVPTTYRTTGRTTLDGAAISMLRPKDNSRSAWLRVASRADRVRILATSCLESALVAEGSVDAFVDPGSDTHRIMDLAAALVTLPAAGGVLVDVHGRPFDFSPDLTRRWSGVAAATPEQADDIIQTVLA